MAWEPLRGCTADPGSKKGRVRLTLNTDEQEFRAWLSPEQAEQVAAVILAARFELKGVVVQEPKRKRKGLVYLTFQSVPQELGSRPTIHEDIIRKAEHHDPEIRSKLVKEQKKWDRRFERKHGWKPGEQDLSYGFLKGRKKQSSSP
jgi:hypothetical protein